MARSSASSTRPQHPSFLSRPMRVAATSEQKSVRINRAIHSAIRPLLPLVSLAESLPPLRPLHSPSTIRPTRRELHSRVYHCPDNNDLPTGELLRVRFRESRRVRLVGLPEKRDEVSPHGRTEEGETGSHLAFGSISL